MKELRKALYDRYNSGDADPTALRAATTGLYPGIAPQNATPIYITYLCPVATTSEWTMDKGDTDIVLVQFSIWDDAASDQGVADVARLLVTAYKDVLLTVAGRTAIRADKIGERSLPDPDGGWQYIVEIEYRIEEN